MSTVPVNVTVPEELRDAAVAAGMVPSELLREAIVAELRRRKLKVPNFETPRPGRPPRSGSC